LVERLETIERVEETFIAGHPRPLLTIIGQAIGGKLQ
jgi:hypothetical protein